METNRMLKLTVLTAVLIAARLSAASDTGSGAGHQHHGKHGGMDSTARTAQAELGAFAVFDAKGVLWAAHKDAGGIVVSRSDDQGRSWSKPVAVTPGPEPTDTGGDARPKIAVGPGGELYVTWTKPMTKPYTGEIRFSRSVDGGKTFSSPITVHHDRAEITHRFDAIAVNPNGKVFVAWIDKRDVVAATKPDGTVNYRGAALYYAVSDDRGATFRGDFKAADNTCECCRIALVPGGNDGVLALWRHVFAPNVRDHAIGLLRADGKPDAVRRASFDDWKMDACPHHGPSLALDAQGRQHAVWFTLAPKHEGIFYGRLRDGGVDGERRIGNETAAHADLATSGSRVAIAWKEFDGERSHLRATVSNDGGNTWKEHQLATTGDNSDQPRVLAWKDKFYVFWNTRGQPLSVTALP